MGLYQFRFDPELLSTFLAVAEARRISAAAKNLNLSQPSVTAHIHALESALETQLFIRSVKGVELTSAGTQLYDKARFILEYINETAQKFQAEQEPKGRLTIAASTTIADHILPSLLAEFKRRYQKVSITLLVKNTEEVLTLVREGSVPLGLVEGHARAASVRLETFLEDELVLVAPPVWASSIRKISDAFRYPFLTREAGSGTRAVIERELKKNRISTKDFKEVLEFGSSTAIKNAVAAELGVSFLSEASLKTELALGRVAVVPLSDLKISRAFRWALPAGTLSGTAGEFYKFAAGLRSFYSRA